MFSDGGGSGDAFQPGQSFTSQSVPSSRWWDGSDSGLVISQIEDLGHAISFVLGEEDDVVGQEAYALSCGTPLVASNPVVRGIVPRGEETEFLISNQQVLIQTITPAVDGRLSRVSFPRRNATEFFSFRLNVSVVPIDSTGFPAVSGEGGVVRARDGSDLVPEGHAVADVHRLGVQVRAGVPIGIAFSATGGAAQGHVIGGSLGTQAGGRLHRVSEDRVVPVDPEASLALSWTIVPDRRLSEGESFEGPRYLEPPRSESEIPVHAQQDVVQRLTVQGHGLLERVVLSGRVLGRAAPRPLHLEITDPDQSGVGRALVRHTFLPGDLETGALEIELEVLDQSAVVHDGQRFDVRLWSDALPSDPDFGWSSGDRGDRYTGGEARVTDRRSGAAQALPNDLLFSLSMRR